MEVILKDEARKSLRKIDPRDVTKVKKKLDFLSSNPLAGKMLSGEFYGVRSLRAWPLRILYTFDPDKQVIIIEAIEYRGQVYK